MDGSKLAEQILPHASAIATRFRSRLVLLRVVDKMPVYAAPGEPKVVVEQIDVIRTARNEAEAYLDEMSKLLRAQGCDLETSVKEGHTGEIIVRFAESNDIKLIALATHGHGGLGRAVFGSVADHVLRHTHLPILCVRPHPADR